MGTVILAYIVGIVMSLSGFMQMETPELTAQLQTVQTWIMNIMVPLAIPLMLFSCDFKLWTKSLPKTIMALFGGILSILVAIVVAFFVFRNRGIENLSDISGMMTGIYTGGTMNFFALGSALKVDPTVITIVYTFEMLVTFPLIMFIVGGGYRFFRKLLPFKDEQKTSTISTDRVEMRDVENYGNMINRKVFPRTMLGFLLSLGFLIVAAGLSLLITGKLNELIIILVITTLSIIASFFKKVRDLPKTFELGMIFILVFSIVVASQFDIYSINFKALPLLFFVLFVMTIAVLLHLIISRFAKINGDLFTVSLVGLLCSPPFIPPVVGAMSNKKVLISGIAIGLAGYAIGTYLGIGIAYVLGLF
ncbi:MAG: DUF819 family protein [Paludibacteraceae bacterium]|nr:DUF819 family protein [Paludibacteraceae bacterium]